MLYGVGKIRAVKEVKANYTYRFPCRVTEQVNDEEVKSHRGTKTNTKEWHDKSVRPQPQIGKIKGITGSNG